MKSRVSKLLFLVLMLAVAAGAVFFSTNAVTPEKTEIRTPAVISQES